MAIHTRTPEVKKSHGESLVKLGERLQESVIYSCSLTPFLYFGKALFEGDNEKISNYIAVVVDGSDFLIVLLILMAVAICFGIWFKNKGYDLIEAANRELLR